MVENDQTATPEIKAFVIGDPISHSRSPLIHGHWLKKLEIAGSYETVTVNTGDLASFVGALKSGQNGFVGGNVTIPHKETVFAQVDHVDDIARTIGAANTIWLEGGQLMATNTDAYGFVANLDASSPGWDACEKAVVMGAGGASRAILYALKERGITDIRLINRTLSRAESLAACFGPSITPGGMQDLPAALKGAGLFVNTSSLGMDGAAAPDLDFSAMTKGALVTDIVYAPLKTPFLAKAEAQGIKIVDGLGMLLHQAVPGFAIWFGTRPEVTDELRQIIINDLELHA